MELPHYEILSDRTNPTFGWYAKTVLKIFVVQTSKTVAWLPWVFVQMILSPLSREAEGAALLGIITCALAELVMFKTSESRIGGAAIVCYVCMGVIYLGAGILVRCISRDRNLHLIE